MQSAAPPLHEDTKVEKGQPSLQGDHGLVRLKGDENRIAT